MILDDNEIEVTAYEVAPWRLLRIERVIGYVCALGEHCGNQALLSKIAKLHDHKGVLNVKWHQRPTAGEKEIVAKAWGSLIGDGAAENVEHEHP